MKKLSQFITEKFRLSKDNLKNICLYDESIIDITIDNFRQLVDVLEEYFKSSDKYKITASIPKTQQRQINGPNLIIYANNCAFIDMKDLEKDFIIARLVVIVNYRKGAYFQAWIVGEEPNDKGVTETLIMAPEHQFEFGHNFRDWLMTINNSKLKDKYQNILNLFFQTQ